MSLHRTVATGAPSDAACADRDRTCAGIVFQLLLLASLAVLAGRAR